MSNELIPDVALMDNTEQRTPLVLVLDSSGSMQGEAIAQLNEGLRLLERELKKDPIASKRVRLLTIEYGGQDEAHSSARWVDAMDFVAPTLEAGGSTPTGRAVDLALAEVEAEKQRFKQAGISYTRPWMFLMSDGKPTDAWQAAAERCRQAEQANKVAVFPVAVGSAAHRDALGAFSSNGPEAVKVLHGLRFKELFLWLSVSMKTVSQSTPGGQVQLPAVDTWTSAPV